MQLREHPKMWFRKHRSWPPIWTPFGGLWDKHGRILQGEIGVLNKVRYHPKRPGRIYLTMAYEGKEYVGCIFVDDEPFCEQIVEKLRTLCGTPVEAIGSLDIICR
jgi:hypothetical protein